ncbi:hypothetical protein KQY30_24795 [Streptomyces sp. GMY02]|uniref:DUF6907 domain-containing protein n=1 Tax=Streptomyces sp. GMY02 TaxID=1333528 RepID=UPI001C2BC6B0|nr:hypothetical protein [Streptomyces sp. GMY02]QXE36946.1 hypothetical protein KQY30_24795 [Streptomyces sp. GMY02]
MTDSDTGQPMLIASTSHNQHDTREITPAQLRAKTAEARAQLTAFDDLADRYESARSATAVGAEIATQVLTALPGLAERIDPAEFAQLTTGLLVKHGLVPPQTVVEAAPPAVCTKYGWCKEPDGHDDLCWSKLIALPSVDGYGEHLLPVGLHAEDGKAPVVGFLDLDLTPAQARERVREISRHLDEVLALADRAEGPPAPASKDLLTAAQRGPEWMAKHLCPDWCVIKHGAPYTSETHEGPEVTAPSPIPFADRDPGDGESLVLAARVIQLNQDPHIWGVKTQVWVDVDRQTLELDVEETDRLIERLEQFLPQLRAVRDHLVEASAGDFPEDEAAVAERLATPAVPKDERA